MDSQETFAVVESTPGYLPEDCDPLETADYSQAVAHANALADELEEQGYVCDRSQASRDNRYAIRCERLDADRAIEVAEGLGVLAHDYGLYAVKAALDQIPFKAAPSRQTYQGLGFVGSEVYDENMSRAWDADAWEVPEWADTLITQIRQATAAPDLGRIIEVVRVDNLA